MPEFLPPYFIFSRAFLEWPRCCISTATPYWIIMKSKTPEKLEKLFPNDYWLLVPWRFYAWHPHHTSRDGSRFLSMMLFINNTKNTFYQTKVLKTKLVSFLKYIYKLIMLYWFSTGHSDQCHWEIYRSNRKFTGHGPSDRCQFRLLLYALKSKNLVYVTIPPKCTDKL